MCAVAHNALQPWAGAFSCSDAEYMDFDPFLLTHLVWILSVLIINLEILPDHYSSHFIKRNTIVVYTIAISTVLEGVA